TRWLSRRISAPTSGPRCAATPRSPIECPRQQPGRPPGYCLDFLGYLVTSMSSVDSGLKSPRGPIDESQVPSRKPSEAPYFPCPKDAIVVVGRSNFPRLLIAEIHESFVGLGPAFSSPFLRMASSLQ